MIYFICERDLLLYRLMVPTCIYPYYLNIHERMLNNTPTPLPNRRSQHESLVSILSSIDKSCQIISRPVRLGK